MKHTKIHSQKALSILAALILLLSLALPALAADSGDLWWKLNKQLVNGSGLHMTLAFDKSESAPPALGDPALSSVLSALLPDSTIEIGRLKAAFGSQKGREETTVRFSKDDVKHQFSYRSDGTLEAFGFSALGDGQWGAAKGETLFSLWGSQNKQLSGLEALLLSLLAADNEWKTQAESLKAPYANELGAWMQRFTAMTTENTAQGIQTKTTITLPMSEVKATLQTLLNRFSSDTALHALLKERMTLREATLYLDPAVLTRAAQQIEALPLTGEITVERRFAPDGKLLSDTVNAPMGGVWGLHHFAYQQTAQTNGPAEHTVTLTGTDGQVKQLTFTHTKADTRTDIRGSLTLSGQNPLQFSLSLNPGAMTLNRLNNANEQPLSAAMEFSRDGLGTLAISLEGQASSGENPRSATRFEGVLTIKEPDGTGKLQAKVTLQSAAPWNIPQISDAQVTRLDSMSDTEKQTLFASWLSALQKQFAPVIAPPSI